MSRLPRRPPGAPSVQAILQAKREVLRDVARLREQHPEWSEQDALDELVRRSDAAERGDPPLGLE